MKKANTLKFLFGFLIFFTLVSTTWGQSPGGVSADLRIWLKANDGFAPGSWTDHSGVGNNYTQTNANRQPFVAPVEYNFNPIIDFGDNTSADGRFMVVPVGGPFSANGLSGTFFTATLTRTGGTSGYRDILGFGATSTSAGLINADVPAITKLNDDIVLYNSTVSAFSGEYPDNELLLTDVSYTVDVQGINYGLNGRTNSTIQTRSAGSSLQANGGVLGSQPQVTNGLIGEVIAYERDLTPLEKQRVRSYLGIKNGVTLREDINVAYDYLDAQGNEVWSGVTNNSVYHNNVAGIARDNLSALHQKQSMSVNEGNQILIGVGDLAITNADNTGSLSDGQFLIWGDNGERKAPTEPITSIADINHHFASIWKVQNTGSVGTVRVAWPKGFSALKLIQSTDATIEGSDVVSDMSANEITLNGVDYNYADVTLSDGQFFTLGAFVQAPGGVAIADVWLKANEGTNSTTTGDDVSSWINYGVSGGVAGQQASFFLPTFQEGAHNFNPAIVDSLIGEDGTLTLRDVFPSYSQRALSTFVTQSQPDVNLQKNLVSFGNDTISNASLDAPLFSTYDATRLWFFWQGNYQVLSTTVSRYNEIPVINAFYSPLLTATGLHTTDIGINGAITPGAGGANTAIGIGNHLHIHGDGGDNNNSGGSISEVISYGRDLSDDEKLRINSYLALKYGITLTDSAGMRPSDYLNSNSIVVWDTTINTGFTNNIAGIANDFLSALHQKQSKSVNEGKQVIIGTTGLANTNEVNTTDLTEGQFLVWGDNGLDKSLSASVSGSSEVNTRFASIWKVQNTGSVGTVRVAWPVGVPDIHLIRSADTTFEGSDAFTDMSGNTIAIDGVDYNYADVTLADGEYFTFAGYMAGPGGVAAAAWYRADAMGTIFSDAGTTPGVDGDNVFQWNEYNATGYDLVQTGTGDQPVFSDTATLANFNPTVTFNGSQWMEFAPAIGLNVIDRENGSIFAAGYVNTVGGNGFFGFDGSMDFPGLHTYTDDHLLFFTFGGPGYQGLSEDPMESFTFFTSGGTWENDGGDAGYLDATVSLDGIRTVYSTNELNNVNLGDAYRELRIGQDNNFGAFNGQLNEAVVFEAALDSNDMDRVETYLAIKYGTTFADGTRDYKDSDLLTVWNATDNNGYHHNIAGIAHDATGSLNQKQSWSTNPGQQVLISTTGLANTNADNATELTDGHYLVWGDNDSLKSPSIQISGVANVNYRFAAIWKAENTDGTGTVRVAWPNIYQNLTLLQSTDEVFDGGDMATPMTNTQIINGVEYAYADVDAASGYFTFAASLTAPGGVVAGILMWHKADDGVTTPGPKDIWQDISGNERDVFQPNDTAYRPLLVTDAAYAADSKNYNFNFNPFYYFDGTDDFFYNEGEVYFPSETSAGSVYGVMQNSSRTGWHTPYGWADDDPNFFRNSDNYQLWRNNGATVNEDVGAMNLPAHIGGMMWRGAADGLYLNVDGRIYADESNNIGTISELNFAIGSEGFDVNGNGNEVHQGSIPEVFGYSVDHRNSAGDELQRINSYLAIKYGITLSNGEGTGVPSYLSSNSTTVWDSTTNSGNYNNIIGIAHDALSDLHQKQSRSVNEAQKLIIGAGSSLFNTNAANTNTLTDGQFLIVGDNGLKQGLGAPLSYTAGSNGEVNYRFEAIWKAQNTGNVGNVTVAWPVGIQNLYLVQSTDSTFDNSDNFTPMTSEVTVNGEVYNTATVTINDGAYFTFAGYGHAPGGVVRALSYWYRADKNADTTGMGADVTSWTDFFSGTVSSQISTAPLPQYQSGSEDYFNFNPGVNFTDNSQMIGNLEVSTLNNVDFDIFTFTHEGMSGTRYFNVGRDNTTFNSSNWDSPGLYTNGNIASRNNTGGGLVIDNPGNIDFDANIPSIMYHTFTDTEMSKGLNGDATGAIRALSSRGQMAGGHIFGSNRGTTPPGGDDFGFTGHIGETIVYGGDTLTTTERRRVDSYLAIKYGITLSRVETEHYLASTEADTLIVWDGTENTVYNNNIFGIARSDIAGFEQKVSKSINTGTILTVAKNNDFETVNSDTSRTSLPVNEGYLMFGDNNDLSTIPYTPTEIGDCGELLGSETGIMLIPREWLVQRTNTTGSSYIQADLSAYASELNTDIRMFVADDENFTQNVAMIPGTQSGNNWVFSYIFDGDNENRYITFGGTYEAAPCEQCIGSTYTLRTGHEWNDNTTAWENQINNEKLNILIGNDADGNPLYANMYADYSEDPTIEYWPERNPRRYGGRWTRARRYDNTSAVSYHRIGLSQSMKASFQISNINTYQDNKNNFEVIGYCNGTAVIPVLTYAYNTSYHTFEISGNTAESTLSWRGFTPNVSTADVRFNRPVDSIVIISSVDRVNTRNTLRSVLYSDITLECAEVFEPTPDNVYVSHSFTQSTLATCGGATTMRIKVTNNNICEDKTIDLHQVLPSGLEYVPGSFNGTQLPAGGIGGATLTYSGSNFDLTSLNLPQGEHWMYIDVANPETVGVFPTNLTFEVTNGVEPMNTYESSDVDLNYYEGAPVPPAPILTQTIKEVEAGSITCGQNDLVITYRMKIENVHSSAITGAEILQTFDYDQVINSYTFVSGEDEDGVVSGSFPLDGGGTPIEPIGNTVFNLVDATFPVGVSYIDIEVNVGSSYDIPEVDSLGLSAIFLVGIDSGGECAESDESRSNEVILPACEGGPIAVNDTVQTTVDTPIDIAVLENDTPGLDPIDTSSVAVTQVPDNGSTVVNPDGTIEYTPNIGFVGTDTLIYQVCDTASICDTAIVSITVLPSQDTILEVSTPMDSTVVVCADTTMVPGTVVSVEACTPANGTAVVDGLTGCIAYTPNAGYVGTDTTCIIVCDANGICDTTLVPIVVTESVPLFGDCGNMTTFDDDNENWRVATTSNGTTVELGPQPIGWAATEGNPGGALREEDLDGNWTEIWTPELEANGYSKDYSFMIGDLLQFDYKNNTGVDYDIYVAIEGSNGVRYYYNFASQIMNSTEWTRVVVPVTASEWLDGFDNNNGPIGSAPSTIDFEEVLSDVDHFAFSIEGQLGSDISLFDNFGKACPDLIAVNDTVQTTVDTPIDIAVLENDTPGLNPIDTSSVAVTQVPVNGTTFVNPDGTIEYTPNMGFVGTDTLIYQVCDTASLCDTAIVSITVLSPQDTLPTVSTPQDVPVVVCADTTMVPGDVVSVEACDPSNGSVTVDGLTGCIEYTPDPGYFGTDMTCIIVCGANGICDTTIIPIAVLPPQDTIPNVSVPQDSTVVICADTTMVPGTVVSVEACDPANGSVTVDGLTGCIEYTPDPGYVGTDTTCIIICDADGICDTTIVPIAVLPPQDTLPVVNTPQDVPVIVCADTTMVPGNVVSVEACDPSNGSVTVDGLTGCIEYTPDPGYFGTDMTCIIVCDANGICDTTIVPIAVLPPQDTISNVSVPQDSTVVICADTTMVPGTVVSVEACDPSNGSVIVDGLTGCIEYTPNPGYVGTDTTCIIVCDDNGICDTTLVPIAVIPPQDTLPVVSVPQDSTVVICADATGLPGTVASVEACDPANGIVVVDEFTGCIEYTPNPGYSGTDTTCIIICDENGICDTTIVPIVVMAPQQETLPEVTVPMDTPEVICVDTAMVPGDLVSVQACEPENGIVSVDGLTGCIIYTPDIGYVGTDTTCVIFCYGDETCDTVIVPIIVVMSQDTIAECLPENGGIDAPNCSSFSPAVGADGNIEFGASDVITNHRRAMYPLTVVILNQWNGVVAEFTLNDFCETVTWNVCNNLGKSLKFSVTNDVGTCNDGKMNFPTNPSVVMTSAWQPTPEAGEPPVIIFARRSSPITGPHIGLGKINVYCGNVPNPSEHVPMSTDPCTGQSYTPEVQPDWIMPFPCDEVSDTAEVIFRTWEAYDKAGNLSTVTDTIVVFRLPKLTPDAFVGAQEDSFYCELEPVSNDGEALKRYASWKQPIGLHDYEKPYTKLRGVTYEIPATIIIAGLTNAYTQGPDVYQEYLKCVILRKADGTEVTIGDMVSRDYATDLIANATDEQKLYGFLQVLIELNEKPVNIVLEALIEFYPYLLLQEGDWILSEGGNFEQVTADWFYNGTGNSPYWFAGGWPSIYGSGDCISYCDVGVGADFGCIQVQVPALTIEGGLISQTCDTICLPTGVHCGITIKQDPNASTPDWSEADQGLNGSCPQTRGVDTWITQTCWAETPNRCAPDAGFDCEELNAETNPDDVVIDYECSDKAIKIHISQWQTLTDTMGPIFDFCYPGSGSATGLVDDILNEDISVEAVAAILSEIGSADLISEFLGNSPETIVWDHAEIQNSIRAGKQYALATLWEMANPTTYRVGSHDCEAQVLVPDVQVVDNCSDVHSVKAMVDINGGTRSVALELTNTEVKIMANGDTCYVHTYSHQSKPITIPFNGCDGDLTAVRYEAADNCWNQSEWYKFINVVDDVAPTVVADRDVNVTLNTKTKWVKAGTFDEGSWDNCAIDLVLARRSDWLTDTLGIGGVDICSDLGPNASYENWVDILDDLGIDPNHAAAAVGGGVVGAATVNAGFNVDDLSVFLNEGEVEEYYFNQIVWLWEDGQNCGQKVVHGWLFAMAAYIAEYCSVADEHGNRLSVRDLETIFDNLFAEPGYGHEIALLGGGWSQAVPFNCEDACLEVSAELLVMDYCCNWGIGWSDVQVEDMGNARLVKRLPDLDISCEAYNIFYKDAVEAAAAFGENGSASDTAGSFDQLDDAFGAYIKTWVDNQNRPTDIEGNLLTDSVLHFDYHSITCEEKSETEQITVERHDGTIEWVNRVTKSTFLDTAVLWAVNGIIGINCAATCVQDVWVDLNECGQGTITRRFYITGRCGDKSTSFTVEQVINVQSACGMRESMFDLPSNVGTQEAPICLPQGLSRDFLPDTIGEVSLKSHLAGKLCNSPVVGSTIKELDVLGAEGLRKYIIDWTVIDWCAPHTSTIREFTYTQEVIATIDPACDVSTGTDTGDVSLITGHIMTELESAVEGVEVKAKPGQGSPLSVETSGSGNFNFQIANGSKVTIVPHKNNDFSNGVSTADLIDMQRHILQKKALDSKFQRIAADVNGNGAIDGLDVLELRQLVLNPGGKFANNTSWRFYDTKTNREIHEIDQLKGDRSVNFTGVKIGDVNYSADPATVSRSASGQLNLNITDKVLKGGEIYRVEVRSDNFEDIHGLQYTLGYADAYISIESIEPGLLNVTPDNYLKYSPGILTASWNETEGVSASADQVLFTIVLKSKSAASLRDVLSLNNRVTATEAYTETGELQNVYLRFNGSENGFSLYQNIPNPYTGETVIGFQLPKSGEAVMTIYDVTGRLIKRIEGNYEAGYNEVRLTSIDLGVSGVLYYQIDTDRYTATKKMIVIE